MLFNNLRTLNYFKDVVYRADKFPNKKFNVYQVIRMIKNGKAIRYFECDRISNIIDFFVCVGYRF
jgi:hypothetical protein